MQVEVVHGHSHCLQPHTQSGQVRSERSCSGLTCGNILSSVPSTERRPEEGSVAALATYCTVRSCTASSPALTDTQTDRRTLREADSAWEGVRTYPVGCASFASS